MITEAALDVVFNIAAGLLSLAPDITWNVDTSVFGYVRSILSVVGYLLPMGTITAIVMLIISITMYKVAVATIRLIWDLLPVV